MADAPLSVAVIDIGSKKNIGWAITGVSSDEGNDIDNFIYQLAKALDEGPLALGFEAPIFVPLHRDATNLTRGRRGDGDRPFTSAVGSTVLVSGLVVISYVLLRLRKLTPSSTATLDWTTSLRDRNRLLLFEAFVTHQQSNDEKPHIRDAKLAIHKFQQGMLSPSTFKNAIDEPDCLNLVGAALLRTGWTTDLGILAQPCLVVRQKGVLAENA